MSSKKSKATQKTETREHPNISPRADTSQVEQRQADPAIESKQSKKVIPKMISESRINANRDATELINKIHVPHMVHPDKWLEFEDNICKIMASWVTEKMSHKYLLIDLLQKQNVFLRQLLQEKGIPLEEINQKLADFTEKSLLQE